MLMETYLVSKSSAAPAREDAPACAHEDAPDLDALAAALPPEYEGHWIAQIVRAFACTRAPGNPSLVGDYWQEAVIAATRALRRQRTAAPDGIPRAAIVKRTVRSRLTDLNRRRFLREGVVMSAEDLPREEEDDGAQRLVEERFTDSAFDRLPRRLTDDIHLALMLLGPRERRTWRAFRDTNGSSREIAAYLGDVSYKFVQRKLYPAFLSAFSDGYKTIRLLRRKAF